MLKNPLNAVDGNTMNIEEDNSDKFYCPVCDGYVTEDEWNNKRNMCYSDWWKI